MEEYKEILEDALVERLELAYFKLIETNKEVKEAVESVKILSKGLYENKDISMEVKRKIEDCRDISNFIERELQEFIYIEGIKDSIKLLKALGILV
ncbi:hypothetical protein SAMN02745784_02742 [Tissierella praeacuta DSM 18095]|uniref:Uncharacterized protein n=1 Tax=Tissierella praeacuta DSM 18095 TaxID=1123404 RepID=A0A1M4YQK0_9FIRM|nr:hypothetical protein [Tissierella praeacuta]TCU66968.1 hypothetical protein EV204_11378 [Tissierella praeacuta]SHF07948.1 hypothetical protein SAMN02745784_02742 [Tissierella praeacuta DSM 18095]SUP02430.1 Uncharacterised protein [Tissierella praeacuta]